MMLPSLLILPALIQAVPAAPALTPHYTFNGALLFAGTSQASSAKASLQALERLLESPPAGQEAEVRRLTERYAPFLWALGRNKPEHPATLLLAKYGLQPWAGIGKAQPRTGKGLEPNRDDLPAWKGIQEAPTHALDCYQALRPLLDAVPVDGLKVIVVAKAGIVMAQEQQDDIAEGLLWGVLSEVMLQGYTTFDGHARQALSELFRIGAETILALPGGGMDPFKGPLAQVRRQLQILPKAKADELRHFMEQLEAEYGTEFRELNGRPIWKSTQTRKTP